MTLRHCNQALGFGLAAVVFFAGNLAGGQQVVAEIGGGVAVFFGNVRALDERLVQRGEDNFHVAQEGDVPDVLQVVGDFRFPGHGVPAVDLCQSAEPLPHGVALALFRGHENHVAHQLGAWPDHGHVALEDVEQLGELVEARAAQELAVTGQAHVIGEQLATRIAFVGHRAELDQPKDLFVFAGARLRKEGVPLHLDGPHNGQEHKQRAQAENGRQGAPDIEDAFEKKTIHTKSIV